MPYVKGEKCEIVAVRKVAGLVFICIVKNEYLSLLPELYLTSDTDEACLRALRKLDGKVTAESNVARPKCLFDGRDWLHNADVTRTEWYPYHWSIPHFRKFLKQMPSLRHQDSEVGVLDTFVDYRILEACSFLNLD